MNLPLEKARFVCYYYCNGSSPINIGLNITFSPPHIEIHLPFGFIRIGWFDSPRRNMENHPYRFLYRSWGWE